MKPLNCLFAVVLMAACQGSPQSSDQTEMLDGPPAYAEETGEWVDLFNGADIEG